MSFVLHGIGVSQGVAIGRAHLISHAVLEVTHYNLAPEDIPAEIARFVAAVKEVRQELEHLHTQMNRQDAPAEFAAFLDVHWMILNDHTIAEYPKELIQNQRCNAEWALTQQMHALSEQFEAIEDPYLRERKADVVQVVERVLKALLGKPGPSLPHHSAEPTILVAHDLSPADALQFKEHPSSGFLTDVGGSTSHTAILARSMGIPAVLALRNARHLIREDDLLIVDGEHGVVLVNPDQTVLTEYTLRQSALELSRQKLLRIRTAKTKTLDGETVELLANIELPSDASAVTQSGAAGVGLFRSEFLFLNRQELPSEDEQFEAYRSVAMGLQPNPVIIRTFDLGADKQPEMAIGGLDRVQTNPALGLRAIRYCLSEPNLFLSQLRALLRASHYGNIKILVPMLCTAQEIKQTLSLIQQAKQTLREENIPFNEQIALGSMLEVPAAILTMPLFLRHFDFLSIGTNDLIQYTLAVDRADETVSYLYDPLHPAVLRLLQMAIKAGQKAQKPISVCGEMAGEPRFTRLLLGLGLRRFSMHPAHILSVKQQILTSNLPEITEMVGRILRLADAQRIHLAVDKLNQTS